MTRKQKISLVVTVLNEQTSIKKLLISLLNQSFVPSEIIIIDAGSSDKTLQIIKSFKSKNIKLIVKSGISRSKARNLGVGLAKENIIAMTDAGCVAKKNWLENLAKPFLKNENNSKSLVVAGFYDMVPTFSKRDIRHNLQECFTVFLGTLPRDFDKNTFLPSTRSIAFNKAAWKKAGGFPIFLNDTAEDTVFSQKLIENAIEIKRIKNARVEWSMPENISVFFTKIKKYAKGDIKSKVIYSQAKGIESHNIKVILVLTRYIVGGGIFLFSVFGFVSPFVFVSLFSIYLFFAFLKVFLKTNKRVEIAVWGPVVQIMCDLAVMLGFAEGIMEQWAT